MEANLEGKELAKRDSDGRIVPCYLSLSLQPLLFLYRKNKEIYLPPNCRVIRLLEVTTLLFSSTIKYARLGRTAGG